MVGEVAFEGGEGEGEGREGGCEGVGFGGEGAAEGVFDAGGCRVSMVFTTLREKDGVDVLADCLVDDLASLPFTCY